MITQELAQEYSRWSTSANQIIAITEGMPNKGAYEARAILERWHLAMLNSISKNVAIAKMREEFLEKKLFTPENVDGAINKIMIAKPYELMPRDKLVIAGGTIKLGRFTKNYSRDRINLLINIARKNGAKDPECTVAIAALRYASLVPGGQQWSVPASAYDILTREYGVDVEGFASPFNSQLIAREGCKFCSLFADTDAIFGSVGNFFDFDFDGHSAVVNPPYIISILDAVTKKCIDTCAKAQKPTRFFIVTPTWVDANFYGRLSACEFLEARLVHNKGETYFEDDGNQITALFNTSIFILSKGNSTRDFAPLEKSLAPPEKKSWHDKK